MAALKAKLKADLVVAMKAHDELTKSTLRMALAAIANAEVAGKSARELDDAEELAILNKEVAKRVDSAQAYQAGSRPELAAKELSEAEILRPYLPKPLTPAEVDAIIGEEVAAVAEQLGAQPTMRQMGQVVKAVNARVQGRADGSTVAGKVRAALS